METLTIKQSSNSLEKYIDELKLLVDERLSDSQKERLELLKEKLLSKTINFAVIGQFKRGKSTFINALLGKPILPTGVIPLTSVVTIVKYAKEPFAKIVFLDEKNLFLESFNELPLYISEKENPLNIKKVKYVEVGFNNDLLKSGIIIVDTPGIGSIHLNNTSSTYSYIPKIDAAIFITSSDPAFSEAELKLLEEVSSVTPNIFFVLNKIDYLSNDDLVEVLLYTKKSLSQLLGGNIPEIFPISARTALIATSSGDYSLLKKSGLDTFELYIRDFVSKEKDKVLIQSTKRQLLSLTREIEMTLDLEMSSLQMSLQEITTKQIQLQESFNYLSADYIKFLEEAKNELTILLSSYNERFESIKSELCDNICKELENFIKNNKSTVRWKFQKEIELLFNSSIKTGLEKYRIILDNEIRSKAQTIFRKAVDKYNSIINNIYKVTSELFKMHFEEVYFEKNVEATTEFEYITYEFKLMVNLDKKKFAFLLPKHIHDKIVVDSYCKRIDFTINYNFNYIIDDIKKKLDRTLIEYNIFFEKEIQNTVSKLNIVIEKTKLMKQTQETTSNVVISDLQHTMSKLKEIQSYLT